MSAGRRAFRPISPEALAGEIAGRIPAGTARVAIDGPPCARPHLVAEAVAEALRPMRPVVLIPSELFWRDASLRLEYGRHDVESYLHWLDSDALRREVLDPVIATGAYLPSLRDPRTNRSTREPTRSASPNTALLVSGTHVLGKGLPFERTVHLAMSAAARARRTPVEDAWTLEADAHYDATVQPVEIADVVVRVDDSLHPAISA